LSAVAEVSPARKTAYRILMALERGGSHADDLLRGPAVDALIAVDRGLATTLVLGVVRWQIWLDSQLRLCLAKPDARLDPEILVALRLGAFQLLCLDRIPAHAAIGESVELAKRAGRRFASGLVNAVLRKLTATAGRLAGSENASVDALPEWMVKRWMAHYGPEPTRSICRHAQAEPPLSIRIQTPEVEVELARAGIKLTLGRLLTQARTVLEGDVAATEAFRRGQVRIQDEGSQLIAELASACVQHRPHAVPSILDACAAPGGKTLILAERHPESRIVACEASRKRLAELRRRLDACGTRIESRLVDLAGLEEDRVFDLVLADVPCSGTGTLGRNPEIRHRLSSDDLGRHAARQRTILGSALRALSPGGRLIYSTCSLEPEENEQVVAAMVAGSSSLRQVSLGGVQESLFKNSILTERGAEELGQCLREDGSLLLLPGLTSTDGFYVALIEKSLGNR
jgi:16S rRNA (cytosine967-C5)-methyltransferase